MISCRPRALAHLMWCYLDRVDVLVTGDGRRKTVCSLVHSPSLLLLLHLCMQTAHTGAHPLRAGGGDGRACLS